MQTVTEDAAFKVDYVPERIRIMWERLASEPYKLDIERMRHVTRSYKATEGQPPCIRAAKALRECLLNMPIKIEREELIVGQKSPYLRGEPLYIESTTKLPEIFMAVSSKSQGGQMRSGFGDYAYFLHPSDYYQEIFDISEEDYKILTEEILPYWEGKTITDLKSQRWKEEGLYNEFLGRYLTDNPGTINVSSVMQGHVIFGLKKPVELGFNGIAHQAEKQLEKFTRDFEAGKITEKEFNRRKDFLEAVKIAAEAVCEFAKRYAKLAEEMAKTEANEQRRRELLEIAERCRRVPAEPPRNFMEALQAIWLTEVAILIHCGGGAITCPGRVDQVLYPFYKKDIESGQITREKALEALMEYYCKLASCRYAGPNTITIGGVDKNGENAVNEVSYLFLEVHKRLKGCFRVNLAVRIHPQKTPKDFLLKACEVHRHTGGIAFYNDEMIIRHLVEADGYSLEDARDYGIIGCVEIAGNGTSNGYTAGTGLLLAGILEAAIHGGCNYIVGWNNLGAAQTPPPTEFKTFEDVKKAFLEQLSHHVAICVRAGYIMDHVIAENYPLPLLSATIDDCIEKGLDITWGGARYSHCTITNGTLATLANSLAAIKWAVFDKKLLTMEELINALRNNFKEAEEIRQTLLRAPKYGNDDDYADELAVWLMDVYDKEIRKYKFWMGGPFRSLAVSSGTHILLGKLFGASPDGRLAREPLSPGLAPSPGTAHYGLTSTLRSAAKVTAKVPLSSGVSLTLNYNPYTIRDDEGLQKFAQLIEGYFAEGGMQIQFNPLSKEILLDAQKHPEKYPELVVKVSGFSARFIELSKEVQDDIIARTEF